LRLAGRTTQVREMHMGSGRFISEIGILYLVRYPKRTVLEVEKMSKTGSDFGKLTLLLLLLG